MASAGSYDIIIVGGGLGGSAFGKAMASNGARVLILESESQFRDRIRGEWMSPWGVAEARELGVYDDIMAGGGHLLPYFNSYRGPQLVEERDLAASGAAGLPSLGFYHPQVQEALILAAASAGAEVRRGARVCQIQTQDRPGVTVEVGGHREEYLAGLVVGADGRNSLMREWGGFDIQREPDHNIVGGVLLTGCPAPEDHAYIWPNPFAGLVALIFPQGRGQARAYIGYAHNVERRLSGAEDLPQLIEMSLKCGAPPEYYTGVELASPLATFQGAAGWVTHPYRQGVALLGDAAYASDPTYGQGMSLTMRDARVLRDALLQNEDRDRAGRQYAEEHDRYRSVMHSFEEWQTQVTMTTGPEADAIRGRVFAAWEEDPTRNPDILVSGPDVTLDEAVRRRYFGLE